MVFTCPRCGFITEYTTNYKKHIKLKKGCIATVNDVGIEAMEAELHKHKINNNITCLICNKKFASNKTLNKHMNDQHESKDKNMAQQIKKLATKLEHLSKKCNIIINNNNNINTNNNNIHININPFLHENINYISKDFFNECGRKITDGVGITELIKEIRFNPNHPENMNVKYHTTKNETLNVYKENRWQVCGKKTTLNEIISNGATLLSRNLLNIIDEDVLLEKLTNENSYEFKLNKLVTDIYSRDKKTMSNLQNKVYAIILDIRDINVI